MKVSIALASGLLLLINTSCKKDPQETCQSNGLALSAEPITNPANSPATITWTKDITKYVANSRDKALKSAVSQSNIKSVRVYDVKITLPDEYSFSDFNSAAVYIGGEKVATMPPSLTSRYESFTLTDVDVKTNIFKTSPNTVFLYNAEFEAVTKKGLPAKDVTIQFNLRYCF
jgi:hypothetical protein